jgi:hypothetical protein
MKESLKGHSPLILTAQSGWLRNQMVPIDSLWTSEKINELLPAMPGNLPDVQDLFYRIQKGPYTWFALVDLSDMFFALPLHPKSREMTTFTWNNK